MGLVDFGGKVGSLGREVGAGWLEFEGKVGWREACLRRLVGRIGGATLSRLGGEMSGGTVRVSH